jgi:hypothetical protein
MLLILGQARSGTSAIAGVLDNLGYNFGKPLQRADHFNPNGYYTNLIFKDLHLKMNKGITPELTEQYKTYVSTFKEPWALKCHAIYPHLNKIGHLLPITHIIHTYRNPHDSALSLARKRGSADVDNAREFIDSNLLHIQRFVHNYPTLYINFVEFEKTAELVYKIADFVKLEPNHKAIECLVSARTKPTHPVHRIQHEHKIGKVGEIKPKGCGCGKS